MDNIRIGYWYFIKAEYFDEDETNVCRVKTIQGYGDNVIVLEYERRNQTPFKYSTIKKADLLAPCKAPFWSFLWL